MEKIIPKYDDQQVLYKYFPPCGHSEFATENIRNIFERGLIRLTGAEEVNDPFENEPRYVGEIAPDHVYKFCVRGYTADLEEYPHLTTAQHLLRDTFPRRLDLLRNKASLFRKYRELIPETFRQSLKQTPFLCLTERCDSQLMWAHYGISHRGICIGFDRKYEQFPYCSIPVTYSTERVPVDLPLMLSDWDGARVDKIVLDILVTKAMDWSYEKEWRFIGLPLSSMKRSNVGEHVDFDTSAIVEVIFGARCDVQTKEFVESVSKKLKHKVDFRTARVSNESYGLILGA